MLAIEELLCELTDEKRNEQGLPPGFRFHPTDEELITFYLASKVFSGSHSADVKLAEVDLNRCEPWELPDVAKMGEREWYLLSSRDRKYPSGLRTNRATGAGYWKATGKDREVYSGWSGGLVGLKKTLVFYKGRAPRGDKTKWVMHEYRLDGHFSYPHTSKEEWVICRIYHKSSGEKRNPMPQGEAANFAVLDVSQSHLFPLHAFPPSIPIFFNTQYQPQRQQLDDANCSLMEKLTPNPIDYHNCLPPEMDSGVLALSAASNATYSDVSALMAFDRAALPRESWPLYFM